MEFVELPREVHPYYVSTQAHPELRSRPTRAHPLFAGLVGAAIERQRELEIPVGDVGRRTVETAPQPELSLDSARAAPTMWRRLKRESSPMRVGVPKEVKNHEYRVAMTPGRRARARRARSRRLRRDRRRASARRSPTSSTSRPARRSWTSADEVWETAEMVLKVKEPIKEEYARMREGQVLFTYLHLAADRPLTQELMDRGVTAIAYETVQTPDGALPLLAPMSEVAGRLAPQVGAHTLMRAQGGRGVLMGGVSGVYAAKVVVHRCRRLRDERRAIALGMQAEVLLLDLNIDRLRRPTGSTRATCRRWRRTATRSSERSSTPTSSSVRCSSRARRRRR